MFMIILYFSINRIFNNIIITGNTQLQKSLVFRIKTTKGEYNAKNLTYRFQTEFWRKIQLFLFNILIYKYYFSFNLYIIFNFLRENMFNTSILYQQMANQNLGLLYANYVALQQKMMENSVYQNYMNFNSYISYAVSMDFKKFQAQYELQQNEKSLTNVQKPSKEVLQKPLKQVPKKKQEKNQKNLNHKSQQIDKSQQVEFSDLDEKTSKEEPKSKALTLDETSQKIQFDDCSIKENKNSDKKFKKSYRSDKYQEIPQIDLIDFAFIRKDPFDRSEIEKRKSSLLARQVENWNELQKTRRNQKLQLRRIKY